MRYVLLFCIILVFITNPTFSQNILCYAITHQGDTVKGLFQNYKKDELRLWNLSGEEKIIIPVDSLQAYTLYEHKKQPVTYEPIQRAAAILPTESFSIVGLFKKETETVPMVRLFEGKFSLYRYSYTVDSSMPSPSGTGMRMSSRTEFAYYVTYDKKFFQRIDNLAALKSTLKDCPAVADKIGQKGYHKFRKHIGKIIKEYIDCNKI